MATSAHHAHASRGAGTVVENYVKAIYTLQSRGEDTVTTSALAERLGVTPGSASAMIKKLDGLGIAEHTRYHGVRLTERGESIALAVTRKHRLLELFLAESLGLSWDRVHGEAELLEHVLSDELVALIDEKLGHPTRDPHGDPIPSADGVIEEADTWALEALEVGARGTLVRVSDSDPAMLRYLAERGIAPGDRLEIVDRQPFGGPLSVRFSDSIEAIGGTLARVMRVELHGRARGARSKPPVDEIGP